MNYDINRYRNQKDEFNVCSFWHLRTCENMHNLDLDPPEQNLL